MRRDHGMRGRDCGYVRSQGRVQSSDRHLRFRFGVLQCFGVIVHTVDTILTSNVMLDCAECGHSNTRTAHSVKSDQDT